VRRFIAKLEAEGLAPSSIRKEVAPLRAIFATAFGDGAMRSNPAAGIRISDRRGDQEEEHAKALTPEELGRFLAELPEEWRLFFEFLAHTGLRVSEAIGLTWGDVEFGESPRLKLRRQYCRGEWQRLKSHYSRRDVPLSTGMARKLWTARRGQQDTDAVFASRNGKLIREENLRRRVLQPAAKRAGVRWVGFHVFRHPVPPCSSTVGANVKQVQEWLGHADPGFTMRTYIHLIDERQEGADFLDGRVQVGNAWATQDPQTAVTDTVAPMANLAH
jgi:integrase